MSKRSCTLRSRSSVNHKCVCSSGFSMTKAKTRAVSIRRTKRVFGRLDTHLELVSAHSSNSHFTCSIVAFSHRLVWHGGIGWQSYDWLHDMYILFSLTSVTQLFSIIRTLPVERSGRRNQQTMLQFHFTSQDMSHTLVIVEKLVAKRRDWKRRVLSEFILNRVRWSSSNIRCLPGLNIWNNVWLDVLFPILFFIQMLLPSSSNTKLFMDTRENRHSTDNGDTGKLVGNN